MTDERPPRFYRYERVSVQSLANLRERIIWCAGPREFNDPFDCNAAVVERRPAEDYVAYYAAKGDPDAVQAAELLKDGPEAVERVTRGFHESASQALREAIATDVHTRGVACLACSPTDILMWAHYSNGHRGYCLGFDSSMRPFSSAKRVEYQSQAPEIHPIRLMSKSMSSDELVHLLMLRKFDTWAYEREWRLLHSTAGSAARYEPEALTDVYFGLEMPEREQELVRRILAGTATSFHRLRRAPSGFALEIDTPPGAS